MKSIINFIRDMISKWLFSYDCYIYIGEGGHIPTQVFKNDAGYDLYTSESISVQPRSRANIHTNIFIKSRRLMWMLLVGRSSTILRYGLMVDSAVIDADYVGELFIKIYNTTDSIVNIPPNIRIAQLIVLPHTHINFTELSIKDFNALIYENYNNEIRNNRGFGSSGL